MKNFDRMNLPTISAFATLCLLSAVSWNADAQRIYLNDVDVSEAKIGNLTLERVESVRFDAEGNVRISAPSYDIDIVSVSTVPVSETPAPNTVPSPSAESPSASESSQTDSRRSAPITIYYTPEVDMSQRYLLTLSNPNKGAVPYDVDVLINGRHVETYMSLRGNAQVDVSEYIQRGNNIVSFVARRKNNDVPQNSSDAMVIQLGVGYYDGEVVRYENILLGMRYVPTDDRETVRNSMQLKVN